MVDFLASWGPIIVAFVMVLVAVEFAMARQTKMIKSANDKRAEQTAVLQKISNSLERVAAALEKNQN